VETIVSTFFYLYKSLSFCLPETSVKSKLCFGLF